MPTLPDFNWTTHINNSPHVVILGAGASKAALPRGDANGKKIPLMQDLAKYLGLRSEIKHAGFADPRDFESVYDNLENTGRNPKLKLNIETAVQSYFESLSLPKRPTLYDYLILSLREKDLIATFNWDPFLAQAFRRNLKGQALPQLAFLHGNVGIGVCTADRGKGFKDSVCPRCGKPLEATKLLYPVSSKNYNADPFISNEWLVLKRFLDRAYMLTIFGYSAPKTDTAAVDLMSGAWTTNKFFELGQVNIVDVKSEGVLEKTWQPFFCRDHYGLYRDLQPTWIMRFPRRSCEAFAMATLQNDPWPDNKFQKLGSLEDLHAWIAPLIAEERVGNFTGTP